MNQYYKDFIDFFKKHNLYEEKMFDYIRRNSTLLDYRDDEQRIFIGCFYICGKQNILQKIKLCVPFINSQITILINIHEYLHAIELYSKIGKKYQSKDTEEVLPMLYESLYFLDNPSKELENHLLYLNSRIKDDSKESYKIALSIEKELLKYYKEENPDFKKLQNKVKKLTKQYKKNINNTK